VVSDRNGEPLVVGALDGRAVAAFAEGEPLDPREGPHRPLLAPSERLELVRRSGFQILKEYGVFAAALAHDLRPLFRPLRPVADLRRRELPARPAHADLVAGEHGPVRRTQAEVLGN